MEALSLRGAINLDVKTTGQEMNLQPSQKRREQRGKIRRVPMEIEPARCNGVLHTDVVLSFSISWKEDERKLETRGKINVVEKKKKILMLPPGSPPPPYSRHRHCRISLRRSRGGCEASSCEKRQRLWIGFHFRLFHFFIFCCKISENSSSPFSNQKKKRTDLKLCDCVFIRFLKNDKNT